MAQKRKRYTQVLPSSILDKHQILEQKYDKYSPKYAQMFEKLTAAGFTISEVADIWSTSYNTLIRWISCHSDFADAYQRGKKGVDVRVVQALLSRCLGSKSEEIEQTFDANGTLLERKVKIKDVLPDVNALNTWLRAKLPNEFGDTRKIEITGKDGQSIKSEVTTIPTMDLTVLSDEEFEQFKALTNKVAEKSKKQIDSEVVDSQKLIENTVDKVD